MPSPIPTRGQWRRWSLPSKLTAVGTMVGILALLYAVIGDLSWGPIFNGTDGARDSNAASNSTDMSMPADIQSLRDIFSLHLAVIPRDPAFVQDGKRMNWGSGASPQAVVLEREDYRAHLDNASIWAHLSDPSTDWLSLFEGADIDIFETSRPEIQALLTYDVRQAAPTLFIEGLAFEVLEVRELNVPFVVRYRVGGAGAEWIGGVASYGSSQGLYPITWERQEGTQVLAWARQFTIEPGEVIGLRISLRPSPDAPPGIYYLRLVMKGRHSGKPFYIWSDKVLRCAVLAENIWDAEGREFWNGWQEEFSSLAVERLRQLAYLANDSFTLSRSGSFDNALLEIAMSELRRFDYGEPGFGELAGRVSEFAQAARHLPQYSWILSFLHEQADSASKVALERDAGKFLRVPVDMIEELGLADAQTEKLAGSQHRMATVGPRTTIARTESQHKHDSISEAPKPNDGMKLVVDKRAGLVWTGCDNGRDVNWPEAKNYCENLTIQGYSEWRLPTISELERIHENEAIGEFQYALTNGILVNGWEVWSSTKTGPRSEYTNELVVRVFSFHFNKALGYYESDVGTASYKIRALCVHSIAGK